ncbi:MAG TPA: Lrp/AsnC family transcriptional regulator [Thermoprotei archaeon]|nr:Lrp/AsnC family transcriptional regulator [Thermoprotei archaeon]
MPRVSKEKSFELDREIAEALKGKDRINLSRIADEVNISLSALHDRVKSLEERGIILGYTAVLEKEKLGFGAAAILMLNVNSEKGVENIAKQIASIPEIEDVYEVSGEPDLVATVWAPSLEELREFINERISKIDGVEDVNPLMLLRVYKKAGFSIRR